MTTSVDGTGFHRTTLAERLTQLQDSYKAIYGTDIDILPESTDGQVIGIFSEALADVDSLAEVVYNMRSPAGAAGAALDRIVKFAGISRNPASYSTVSLTLGGVDGTVIPSGSLVGSTVDATLIFQTTASATISGGTATVVGRAQVTGPVHALNGILNRPLTVISGWNTVTNAADATLGADVETDAALRIRFASSVALPSLGILDGLYAALAAIAGVTDAAVYENNTSLSVVKGSVTLPPHSIYAIVDGGTQADIAAALWLKKSAGVTVFGSVAQNITDSQGNTQTMRFDRPTQVPIYVTVKVAAPLPNATVKTAIAQAIVDWGDANSKIGVNVFWAKLFVPVNTIDGIDVLAIFVGTSASPTLQQDVVIDFNARASWNTARVTVTV